MTPLQLGERVTVGKSRRRYVVVVLIRGVLDVATLGVTIDLHERRPVEVAVVARSVRAYWGGTRRGRGRRVAVSRLRRVMS